MKNIKCLIKSLGNNFHIILAVAALFFVVFAFALSKSQLKNARKNAKYTIAYIMSDWHQKNNNGVGTDFMYYVNGEKIDKTCASSLKKGTRYIVLYDSIRPKNYIMLYNHELSNTMKAPANGWKFKEVPIKLDSADLRYYFEKLDL